MHPERRGDPADILLPRVQPPRRGALARHEQEPAWRLLPLYSRSGTYREWEVVLHGTQYCVVGEDDTLDGVQGRLWTLLRYEPHCGMWETLTLAVGTFLRAHHLLLAD